MSLCVFMIKCEFKKDDVKAKSIIIQYAAVKQLEYIKDS